ncbi:dTDP-glucose 4,6-dehydratase [Candidatus Roizmanbacteria bacterium]|nr:dTDP-glucose 4,6-dehydratase [Candidatus Roizmanbacteria bacterium]
MKLLVTGGAGFIGANFILYWLKKYPQDQVVNLESIKDNTNYSFVHGDICDSKIVDETMDGVDIVVHFAADSHVDRSILDPDPFVKTNIEGTYVLLKAALKHNLKRFHHISTDEVFGALELDSREKFTEKTPYNPRSPYSASKAASDHLVRSFGVTFGLPYTITNCGNNYGPYQFPEKLISLTITNLIEGKKVPVYGDGLYVRDWLYVEDHCEAIDLVLKKGKVGETYLIGGLTEGIPNIEVVKRILKLMGKGEDMIESVKDRPGHDRKYDVDWSKIKNDLGWQPKHSFDDGLKVTVDWYMQNQDWWKRVKTGEYKDYYEKQYGKA